MNTIHSPSNIETLLWFHTRNEPIKNADAPAIKETIEEFVRMGVIVSDIIAAENGTGYKIGTGYKMTAFGDAWVKALCNVPPPNRAFIDEMGRVL